MHVRGLNSGDSVRETVVKKQMRKLFNVKFLLKIIWKKIFLLYLRDDRIPMFELDSQEERDSLL